MVENLILIGEGIIQIVQNVFVYGVPTAGGVGGLVLLYKAGQWIKRL